MALIKGPLTPAPLTAMAVSISVSVSIPLASAFLLSEPPQPIKLIIKRLAAPILKGLRMLLLVLSIVVNRVEFIALNIILYIALCSRVKMGQMFFDGLISNEASVCRGSFEWHSVLLKR